MTKRHRIPGLKAALTLASPGGKRGKASILIYHRVLAEADVLRSGDPDIETFSWQMSLLAEHFNVLPLSDTVRRLQDGTLPPRAASITFDDGYADNYTYALPILKQLELSATFFIATAYLDGGRMFNDTLIDFAKHVPAGTVCLSSIGQPPIEIRAASDRRALMQKLIGHFKYQPSELRSSLVDAFVKPWGITMRDDLMMSTAQLKALHSSGMEIGAHTDTHPILAKQMPESAASDILLGKRKLEALLKTPVRLFAYPNGRPEKDYTDRDTHLVSDIGFQAAVSTRPAAADCNCSVFELPRFTPWDTTPTRFGLRLLQSLALRGSVGG